MSWVFNWIFGLFNNAVATLFNVFASIVITAFSLDGPNTLSSFFKVFPMFIGIEKGFTVIAFFVILFILLKEYAKGILNPEGIVDEPALLAFRAILFLGFVIFAQTIVGIILTIGTIPFKYLNSVPTADVATNFTQYMQHFSDGLHSAKSSIVQGHGISSGMTDVILLIVQLAVQASIFFAFLKLTLSIIERYITLCVYCLFSPILIATGFSKSTSIIFKSWLRSLFGEMIALCMGSFFLNGFVNGIHNVNLVYNNPKNYLVSGSWFKSQALATLMLLAWLICGQKVDQLINNMGLRAVNTSSPHSFANIVTNHISQKQHNLASNFARNYSNAYRKQTAAAKKAGKSGVGMGGFLKSVLSGAAHASPGVKFTADAAKAAANSRKTSKSRNPYSYGTQYDSKDAARRAKEQAQKQETDSQHPYGRTYAEKPKSEPAQHQQHVYGSNADMSHRASEAAQKASNTAQHVSPTAAAVMGAKAAADTAKAASGVKSTVNGAMNIGPKSHTHIPGTNPQDIDENIARQKPISTYHISPNQAIAKQSGVLTKAGDTSNVAGLSKLQQLHAIEAALMPDKHLHHLMPDERLDNPYKSPDGREISLAEYTQQKTPTSDMIKARKLSPEEAKFGLAGSVGKMPVTNLNKINSLPLVPAQNSITRFKPTTTVSDNGMFPVYNPVTKEHAYKDLSSLYSYQAADATGTLHPISKSIDSTGNISPEIPRYAPVAGGKFKISPNGNYIKDNNGNFFKPEEGTTHFQYAQPVIRCNHNGDENPSGNFMKVGNNEIARYNSRIPFGGFAANFESNPTGGYVGYIDPNGSFKIQSPTEMETDSGKLVAGDTPVSPLTYLKSATNNDNEQPTIYKLSQDKSFNNLGQLQLYNMENRTRPTTLTNAQMNTISEANTADIELGVQDEAENFHTIYTPDSGKTLSDSLYQNTLRPENGIFAHVENPTGQFWSGPNDETLAELVNGFRYNENGDLDTNGQYADVAYANGLVSREKIDTQNQYIPQSQPNYVETFPDLLGVDQGELETYAEQMKNDGWGLLQYPSYVENTESENALKYRQMAEEAEEDEEIQKGNALSDENPEAAIPISEDEEDIATMANNDEDFSPIDPPEDE